MGKPVDPCMGPRAYKVFCQYITDNDLSVVQGAKNLGLSPAVPYKWAYGVPPSAYSLKMLAKVGLDVLWVLLGEE